METIHCDSVLFVPISFANTCQSTYAHCIWFNLFLCNIFDMQIQEIIDMKYIINISTLARYLKWFGFTSFLGYIISCLMPRLHNHAVIFLPINKFSFGYTVTKRSDCSWGIGIRIPHGIFVEPLYPLFYVLYIISRSFRIPIRMWMLCNSCCIIWLREQWQEQCYAYSEQLKLKTFFFFCCWLNPRMWNQQIQKAKRIFFPLT